MSTGTISISIIHVHVHEREGLSVSTGRNRRANVDAIPGDTTGGVRRQRVSGFSDPWPWPCCIPGNRFLLLDYQ